PGLSGQQGGYGQVVGAPRGPDLAPGAVLRILVRTPADEARAVPEAILFELVVAHLADELRLDRVPVELLAACPAALAAGHPVAADRSPSAQLRKLFFELAPHRCGETGAVPDEVEPALLVIEPEQQRGDPPLGLLAPAEADDHAVRGPIRLHLDDAVARAWQVGNVEPFRDHAVEPGRLESLQPVMCLLRVPRLRREPELLPDPLELGAPLLQRQLVNGLTLPAQEVEGDELRRDLSRELADPAFGGVEPQLHGVEVEDAVALDHDLSVERRVWRQQLADRPQLREVAQQWPGVSAPDRQLALQVLHHPAKAVPLRLVLPVALGKLGDELGFHRREGEVSGRHSSAD